MSAAQLPTDAAARKAAPMARGLLDYFPRALAAVAGLSLKANEQHNPGEPLHWAREKSSDHADCIMRHLVDRGTVDTDGELHSTKVAWRALAALELEIERNAAPKFQGNPRACAFTARDLYDQATADAIKHAPKEHRRVVSDDNLRAAGLLHWVLQHDGTVLPPNCDGNGPFN